MSRLPLHVLPTFCAVATRLNLRAVAEDLHLTHSAVSQQIRLLEERLGFALFERHGRRLALNAAGAALLRAVSPALAQIDDGAKAATAAHAGHGGETLRVTALPSFAQRWLLPRMADWRARHPAITLELHTSQQTVDLLREGFHAGLRTGPGPWRGLEAEALIDSPLVVVGPPEAARRLGVPADPAALAAEALLGDGPLWERWLAAAGHRRRIRPVAEFNDAGLMLQATEQGLGVSLVREVLARDALGDGRLVQLSPLAIEDPDHHPYWLVYPQGRQGWAPLQALRDWLREQLARPADAAGGALSPASSPPAGTATAGRTGSRSRAASAPARRRRG